MSGDLKYEKSNIELRRGKVLELVAQGVPQNQIAQQLNVSTATVSLDMQYLKCMAQENLKTHIEERLPAQYEECHTGLTIVLRKAWEISNNSTRTSEVLQALSLISDTYGKIMDLTTDGTTLEQAMNFIAKRKEQLQSQSQPQQDQQEEDQTADTAVISEQQQQQQ